MIRTVIRFFILVVVAALAVLNAQAVPVSALWWQADVSLALVVLAAFAAGFLFGALWLMPSWWRHRNKGYTQEKRVQDLEGMVSGLQKQLTDKERMINPDTQ